MFDNARIELRAPGFRWVTVPVARGDTLRGLVAGPVRVVECHSCDKVSKPCRRALTNGQCACYCDKEPCSLRTYGYLPLFTRDLEEVVVILSKTTTLHCLEWPHGTAVEVAAPAREKARTRIRMITPDDFPSTTVKTVKERKPADIRPYLVYVLWHDEPLCRWFDQQKTAEVAAVHPPLLKRPQKKPAAAPAVSDKALSVTKILVGIGPSPDGKQ